MVVMDASILLLLLRPEVNPPIDPATGRPVDSVQERLNLLVATLDKAKTKICIPTPVLSELLVRAGSAAAALVDQINKLAVFQIEPFDTLASIEVALMTRAALDAGDKREALVAPWTKVKYDRQIVAIARVVHATAIYSDDKDIKALAERAGIPVIGIADLPQPPTPAQGEFALAPQEVASHGPSEDEIKAVIAEGEQQEQSEADDIRPGLENDLEGPAAEGQGESEAAETQQQREV